MRPDVRLWAVAATLALTALVYAAQLSEGALQTLLDKNAAPYLDHASPSSLLAQILTPRVPGTSGHAAVQRALIGVFEERNRVAGYNKWHIETLPFAADTPLGPVNMTNIVVSRDPHAPRKLVLAAHYDSKYFAPETPEHGFLGATDSAFPCALLVDVAMALDEMLDRQANATDASNAGGVALELLFLDGEEAFMQWTASDSLYGARQLAMQWAQTWMPRSKTALGARHLQHPALPIRRVQSIEHFVLLDLLGAARPQIPYYFQNTRHIHEQLQQVERRLVDQAQLWPPGSRHPRIFQPKLGPGIIEDDHVPFLAQNVPIVHLIPWPFPSQWHTARDNAAALDPPTMQAWSRIMRVFTAEYLALR